MKNQKNYQRDKKNPVVDAEPTHPFRSVFASNIKFIFQAAFTAHILSFLYTYVF